MTRQPTEPLATKTLAVMGLKVQRQTRASRIAVPTMGVVLVVAATVPLWGSSAVMKQAINLLTLIALAQMWNLLAGYAGLVSVGQQAFVGIGAYTLWALADKVGINPFLCVPLAGIAAAIIALPTAGIAFRLRGGYFAIGTWVMAEFIRLAVLNTSWMGGATGVSVKSAGQISRSTREPAVYLIALAVMAASVGLAYVLLRSRRGLSLTAIRDNDKGAQSLGVDLFKSKLWVFIVAAFGTGAIGAVIYLNLLTIQPQGAFSLNWVTLMFFAVVVGGLGTLEGPIIGAVIYFALQQLLADYGSWYLILFGVIAALMVVLAPRGIWGAITRRWPVDLTPVRRRLCVEELCFAENYQPAEDDPTASTSEARLPPRGG